MGPLERLIGSLCFYIYIGEKRRREEKKGSQNLPKASQSVPKIGQAAPTWRQDAFFCTTFQHFVLKVAFSLETSSLWKVRK